MDTDTHLMPKVVFLDFAVPSSWGSSVADIAGDSAAGGRQVE
jgi:hypothetical protein